MECKGTEKVIAMNKVNAQKTKIAEQLGDLLKKRNAIGKLMLAMQAAKFKAAKELADENQEDSLKDKLEKAGIVSSGSSAQDVLDRLKQKNTK